MRSFLVVLLFATALSFGTVANAATIPKDQFIAQADAICKQTDQKRQTVEKAFKKIVKKNPKNKKKTAKQIATYLTKMLVLEKASLAKIQALGQPATDQAIFAQFVQGKKTLFVVGLKVIKIFRKGDYGNGKRKYKLIDAQANKTIKAAKAFGFQSCFG